MLFSSQCFKILLGLILITGLQGCSKKNEESNGPYTDPTYETSNPLKDELEAAPLDCNNERCNKANFEAIGLVGMVVEGKMTDDSYRVGQCTGFLYGASDIVGLNSHCISDSMWNSKKDCHSYLGIKFPETPGHPSEVFMCEEILFRSAIGEEINTMNLKADYAFFRIKQTSRKPLDLAAEPSKPQELISVRKVNPIDLKTQMGGHLDYAQCHLQNQSMLNIKYQNEWSDTALAVANERSETGSTISDKSCKIIQGNSGSPVLNAQNQVIGFAQSYFTEAFLEGLKSDEIQKAFSKDLHIATKMNLPNVMPDHFQFTQSICARSPKNISAENSTCRTHQASVATVNQNYSLLNIENTKNVSEYVDKIKVMALAQYPAFIDFDFTKNPDAHVYAIEPRCVQPMAKWNWQAIDKDASKLKSKVNIIRTVSKPIVYELVATVNFDKNLALTSKTLTHTMKTGRFSLVIEGNPPALSIYRNLINTSNQYFSYEENASMEKLITWCP